MSAFRAILLQKSKIKRSRKSREVDLWTPLLVYRAPRFWQRSGLDGVRVRLRLIPVTSNVSTAAAGIHGSGRGPREDRVKLRPDCGGRWQAVLSSASPYQVRGNDAARWCSKVPYRLPQASD